MTTHYLSGVRVQIGGLLAFPLCHSQLQLYDGDELTNDITRVQCPQCRTVWVHNRFDSDLTYVVEKKAMRLGELSLLPFDEWVCEGEERCRLKLERARRSAVVDRALEKHEEQAGVT